MVGISEARQIAIEWLKPLWTKCNDWVLNIDTEPPREQLGKTPRSWWRGDVANGTKHGDNNRYASIDYWNIRKVIRLLAPGRTDVFYDIGSGKGRIVCVAARSPFKQCIGVEVSEALCDDARRNARRLNGRRAPIEIICADAATADLSTGTVYFMFNPFGADTLRDTVENIKRTLETEPRAIRILYYNCVCESVLANAGWLTKTLEYDTYGGLRVSLWKNSRSAASRSTCRSMSGRVL